MVTVKVVKTEAGKHFEVAIKNLQGKVGKVGWFEKTKYPPKEIIKNDQVIGHYIPPYVAQVAAIQEYGSPSKNIPARPFIRPTILQKRNEWKRVANLGAKKVLKGEWNSYKAMETLGQKAAGDIKKKISQIFSPALAESTVMARIRKNSRLSRIRERRFTDDEIGGIAKPLIDTGLMFKTLISAVEDE